MAKLFGDDTWESVLEYAHATLNDDPEFPPWLPGPVRRFIEAARRLGRSNKKLIAFERGFISEGGIKDREWYKHLGVAPGKWLGKPFKKEKEIRTLILIGLRPKVMERRRFRHSQKRLRLRRI